MTIHTIALSVLLKSTTRTPRPILYRECPACGTSLAADGRCDDCEAK